MTRSLSQTKRLVSFHFLLTLALLNGLLALEPLAPAHAAYNGAQYALDFDDSNHAYVEVPDAASLDAGLGNSFTIEAWIRTREDADNMIFAKHSGGAYGSYYLATFAGGKLNFTVLTSNGRRDHEVSYAYNDGQWHHVAAVYDGSYLTIYVDGVQIGGMAPQSGSVDDTGYPVRIGYYAGDPDWFYDGTYDEIRLWDDVRTVDEIRANMYKELSGSEAGLVAYYRMSDGSGTALTDDSGHSHTGTLINGPTWVASGAFAGPRSALDFDGTNDYILFDASAPPYSTTITLEAWIKTSDAGLGEIVGWGNASRTDVVEFGVYNGKLELGIDVQGAGRVAVTSATSVNTGNWVHMAALKSGTSVVLYIDGVQDATGAIDRSPTVDRMRIGGLYQNGSMNSAYYLSGQVDEVRVWSTVRTIDQIRENMFRTLDGDESGLVAYYRFDQYNASDQTTLYNLVSDSYRGTLTNMEAASDWVSSSAFNTWLGSEDTDWAAGSNWSRGSEPTSSDNVGVYAYSSLSHAPAIGAAANANHLLVAADATLVSGAYTLGISGNWFNDGAFDAGGGTVVFNGSGTSTLSGSSTTTFYDLQVNSGTTVDVGTSTLFDVAGTLTNNGGLRQTRSVSGSGDIEFLNVSTDKYYGVMINPSGNDLGSTAITVHGNQLCPSASSGVLRCFELEPTTPRAATVRFYYTEAEQNGQDNATVDIYHWNDSTSQWNPEGGAYQRGGSGDGQWAQVEDVDEYSPFALGNHSPMAVTLAGFSAAATAGTVLLEWETASEVDLLGFDVYRAEAPDGPQTRLNAALIPAQAPGSLVGAVYQFRDEAAEPGLTCWYWLKSVDAYGQATRHGPTSVEVPLGGQHRFYLPLVSK
jgi:hypothetical protein